MIATISFRPIVAEDEPLLWQIYASTREEELKLTNWEDDQKRAFLTHQFNAQHAYYSQQFAEATFSLILDGEMPIGRLYVDRREDEIHIIKITLLPEFRGQGIGSSLLKDLLAEAAKTSKSVRIHVQFFSRAMRLYKRLGFRKVDETGSHVLLEWRLDCN